MQYTPTATSVTSEDGTRSTRTLCVNSAKQFNTYFQQTNKQLPKMEQRFFPAIWLGRDTTTGETLLGIASKVVRARTIRRMPHPEKYNKQLFEVISRTDNQQLPATGQAILNQPMIFHPPRRPTVHTETQTAAAEEKAVTDTPQPPRQALTHPTATAAASSPMATAPTSDHTRQPLPSPKRTVPYDIPEGSFPKQQRSTASASTGPARPEETPERPKTRMRITKITLTTKQGTEITAYSCEDVTEQQTEKILLEPWVNNTEGLDKAKTIEGMKNETQSMKTQQVYIEVHLDTLTPQQRQQIIQSRWVLREKGNTVRARIVAKG